MSLKYLLDTNICIHIMKQKPKSVLEKFEQLEVGMVGMSAITYGELMYGAQKSNQAKKAMELVHQVCNYILPLSLSLKVPEYYAVIRAGLEKQGRVIGNNDLWIAAHCLELGITLVTNNEKEFSRVDKLKIENWV
ncbi:type II toxin-antitoxin system tRNA(fMet)-specific endonuclease VapC [Legionella feeleii]|uniref:Ribonuclease VapC n=1 Tax=Legionella feeleii TaxID=453 RepID=A0A0W0TZK6_9GAMM|nr:type II toxin-antitoxin system VapC family toxin [Legionella feeleii]KTD01219.1 tRNA(fMet)-specific endonuclease VapC [Legionella feeleii]SPX60525.1 tRNA(fMet)-specific endonuclease VapC [Legionella feeleii]